MAQIALDVQNATPQDPLLLAAASVPSSYTEALDTVRDQFILLYPRGIISQGLINFLLGAPCRDLPRARRIVEKAAWFPIFIVLSRS